jgi:glutamine amidotransferase
MTREVTVLDYGSGNLFSIGQALSSCGVRVHVTSDAERIVTATHLVIPGVGAFGQCMEKMRQASLIEPLREAIGRGAWVLGICVGMQMLLDSSAEFGVHPGLGLIPGKVVSIPAVDESGRKHKVPYVGWSPLYSVAGKAWENTILSTISPGSCCYFVHSFMACPNDERRRLAETYYGATRVCAAVQFDNVFGTQFHPEKSGEAGLAIVSRFLEL